MTTKQIMDASEDGLGREDGPGFSFRGAGPIQRRARAVRIYKLIRDDMNTDGRTFEDYEMLAKLKGKVV